jgi:hypothetical protein
VVKHHGKFVSYLRVSTKRQAQSGLGLEAQRAAVTTFLNGGNWKLVEAHVEIEIGFPDRARLFFISGNPRGGTGNSGVGFFGRGGNVRGVVKISIVFIWKFFPPGGPAENNHSITP